MTNPYAGFDPENPWHWLWFVFTIIMAPIFLVCLITGPPGWFIGVLLYGLVAEFMPTEIEREVGRRSGIKNAKADAANTARWERDRQRLRNKTTHTTFNSKESRPLPQKTIDRDDGWIYWNDDDYLNN